MVRTMQFPLLGWKLSTIIMEDFIIKVLSIKHSWRILKLDIPIIILVLQVKTLRTKDIKSLA